MIELCDSIRGGKQNIAAVGIAGDLQVCVGNGDQDGEVGEGSRAGDLGMIDRQRLAVRPRGAVPSGGSPVANGAKVSGDRGGRIQGKVLRGSGAAERASETGESIAGDGRGAHRESGAGVVPSARGSD